MKINKFVVSVIISVVLFTSCAKMDYNEVTIYDEEWMYDNESQVSGLLGIVYGYIHQGLGDNMNGAMLASATDESDYSLLLSTVHRYYNGAWSSVNAFPDTWYNSYRGIYAANDFMENMIRVFESLKDYENNAGFSEIKRRFDMYPYQARFLRAFYHFELAKTYGDVPLITRTLSPSEANEVERTPVQDVFKFIVDECDAVKEMLPISYADEPGSHIGRINRPTVLALKARTLLYAASPLFNPSNPKEAWRKAAVACKELIDYASGWEIVFSEYQDLWSSNSYYAEPEIIWFRYAGNTNNYAMWNYPVGYENTLGGNCPSQTLVDAYEYRSGTYAGKSFGEVNGDYFIDNPYQNLDPRFAMTIAKNGDTWPLVTPYRENPLETFDGGRNGAPIMNATKTGYYLKKYVNGNNRVVNPTQGSHYTWITYRLAEFYLNYAEAMFHYMDDDATATSEGILNMSANGAINVLRDRADIKMPLFTAATNGEQWLDRYKRERMVELAFEGHRFWDVRRWKDAEAAGSFMKVKTVRVNRIPVPGVENAYTYNYNRGPVINRGQWNNKYYLYPIPFTELKKAVKLEQNPGWE